MDSSLQIALKNLIEKQATSDELDLLRQAFSNGQIFIGGNVQNSVIIVGSGNSVQLTPEALERLVATNNLSALHQLPQPPTDFVGREQELKSILTNIEEKRGVSISSLTGMGGVGKTALGLVAAHELAAKYSDAQFFVDLRGITKKPLQSIDVMKHVVQSVHPTADLTKVTEAELSGAYHSVFSEKKAILFLDNVSDAGQVVPLLPPPSSCVFITSRWQFPVPGLTPLRLDVLTEETSIKLLISLCSRITEENARQISALCGYLPIALRLAGGYLQVNTDWTPEEYIIQLSKKNEKIKTLYLERSEININAVFTQSFKQLSRKDQQFWSMLAVFPISFDRNAIADVWNLADEEAHAIASKLCRYNLMEHDIISKRYHLHDLLIDFANKKIKDPIKEISLLNYFVHYQQIWITTENLYVKGGAEAKLGLQLFDTEHPHIETAYQWAIENADAHQIISTLFAGTPELMSLAHLRMHPNQRIKWFQVFLNSAQKKGNLYSQSSLLGAIGVSYFHLAQYQRALEYLEQALKIARKTGVLAHQEFCLRNLGNTFGYLGESQKMIEFNEKAFEIAVETGNQVAQGLTLGNIGAGYSNLGESKKAIEFYEKALSIARDTGDIENQGKWLGNTGIAYIGLGENRKAIDCMEQALKIAYDIGDLLHQTIWLGNIGAAISNLGKDIKAIEYYKKALEIAYQISDKQYQGMWLGNVGNAYINLGELRTAIGYSEQALEIAHEIGDQQQEGFWLGDLGVIYDKLNDLPKAIEYVATALEISRKIGDRWRECEWLSQLGNLYIKMKDIAHAKNNLTTALKISKELNARELEGRSSFNLAKMYQIDSNMDVALEYAQNARSIFESIELPELEKVNQFIESLTTS